MFANFVDYIYISTLFIYHVHCGLGESLTVPGFVQSGCKNEKFERYGL